MQKFCAKCGAKLDDETGLCPNCDSGLNKKELKAAKKEHRKVAKKEKKAKKTAQLSLEKKYVALFFCFFHGF